MNNIWIATDWHLWNTEYDDGRHQFKSITRLGQLADEYTSVIGSNDLFIHLGDLCDPSNTRPENLKSIIQSIPGTKILCRGNHDTEPDSYYLDAGFNYVCDILKIHDIIFSHKPINITPDQINIHGHLHTRKLSTLDGRYINAYDINYSDKPALLEDLLQGAVYQKSSDYTGTEFKQDKIDKVFDSIEDDHYENILDLSSEFDLTEQFIQENETYRQMLRENSIPTGINVHDLMETTIAPVLHSLSATEIEKDEDPLDEIIFEEPEDTIKWEQDDDNPNLYKEKELMAESATKNLYHLSEQNLNNKTLTPRIPDNFLVKNGYEDKETPRVCFTSSINKSLRAMSQNLKGKEFYVHIPSGDYETYKPSTKEVPDSKVTGEVWITEPVKLTCIGKIKVGESTGDGIPYQYGNNTAELYDWEYEWIEKYDLNESVLKSEPDIYYNKEKFDSGEINLCFITGHSGSGKSTMAHGIESKNIEVYEIDDVNNVSSFSDENLKEYGDLIYSYFKGPGKKYRVPYQGWTEEWYEENGFGKFSSTMKYYEENTQDFVHYAMKYAKSHSNKKFIVEGLQLFCFCNANEFKDYAVYIKGTSAAKSFFRSLKRDINYGENIKAKTQFAYWKIMDAKNYARHEKAIDAWRDYFSKQMESMNESTVKSNIDKDHQQKGRKSLSELKEVVMTADQIAKYKDDNKMLKHILPDDGKDVNSDKKHFACVGWMDGINLAAIVSVRYPTSNSRDDYNWIQALEVTENYRGYGLSAQVLDYAVKKLHGNALAVHNDNEIAHKLYLKYGFKDGEINDVNTKMYLGSINESILYTNDPVDIFDYKYEVIQEATRGDDTLYPVYVFLVNSGSLMAKMINAVTGDDYTHASIGFEPDLKTMYSFGGKQENGSGFGFSIESIDNEWYKGKDMAYAIYCVFVNKAQLKRMKDRVQYFVKHGTHFLFDFPGLVLNAMNVSANPQHRWFCSRFVADVLNAGSPTKKKQYIKDASYMRPNDFTQTNFAHYICGGIIKNFRASIVRAKTAKALEQEKTERMIRDKNWHYQVSRFQESVAELHSLDYDAMSKINTKYDIRPPGYNYERDREIAEYEKARAKKKAEKQKLKEKKIRDKNRQKLKAAKKAKTIKTIKNEEMEYNYLFGDQNRFFDWNDYHNTVLGEDVRVSLTLKDKSFRFINTITESTGYNGKLVPVYIILTYTGSFVSRTVKLFTGDEYTHASISFDSSLTTMYTFGRARDESITDGMFKIEDISSPYYQERKNPVPYGVFCVPVTPAEKKNMEKKIAYFAKNKSKFQFDFFGLILNGLGIPNNPKNRYFCSRFVAEILNAGDPDRPLVKEPSLQHPQTFAEDDYTYFVCSGPSIIEYDQVLCDRITKDILRTEQFARAKKNRVKNENFMNLNPYNPYQSNILHYKFAMLEDAEYEDFMDYLSNFKIQYDSDDNIIVSRKEYDQLYRHYAYAKKNATIALEHGNLDGVKDELAKIHYIASMISKYYLSPSVMQSNRVKGDIKKDFAELRGLLLDTFNQFHSAVKAREPGFNFIPYYETSKYAKDNPVIEKIRTHLGETVVIRI